MENHNRYENLNFRRWVNRWNRHFITFIISILGYLILMWILPNSALVTILLFLVPVLIWGASYGWRTALTQVIRYLQRFQIN